MVEEIRLGPLGVGEVRALIEAESQQATDEIQDELIRGSEGNPLIALELARSNGVDGSVPRTLSDVVMARLTALDEDVATVIRWATVLEHGPVRILARACSNEVVDFVATLDTAIRYHFIDASDDAAGGHYSMGHTLIQRIVYESISPVKRSAMHTVLAELLGEDRDSADRSSVITYHAIRADRPDLAARALVTGARECAVLGVVDEAAKLADGALKLVPRLQPAAAVAVELEALLVLAQVRKPRSSANFVTRLTELGMDSLGRDRTDLAHRAFQAAANLRWEAGDGGAGYGLARQAWQVGRTGTPSERVKSSAFMAMCLVLNEKQLSDAQAIVHEAETVARAEQPMNEPVELGLARGLLHLHAGRFDEARRDAIDSRTLAKLAKATVFEALSLQLRMQLEYAAGQRSACMEAAEQLEALAPQIREGGEDALAKAARALVADDLDSDRAILTAATDRLAKLDDKRRLAWVANRWAHRERIEGHGGEARRLAELALEASLAVEAISEAGIAACELLAVAMLDASSPIYAETENTLAEIEARSSLSFEARRLIEEVTS
jgi:hypothetical protein